jgi:hypothetical protein
MATRQVILLHPLLRCQVAELFQLQWRIFTSRQFSYGGRESRNVQQKLLKRSTIQLLQITFPFDGLDHGLDPGLKRANGLRPARDL